MNKIISYYVNGSIQGWNESLAKENFRLVGNSIKRYGDYTPINSPRGKRRMLWEYSRKVLNKDIPNIAQLRGDCVSWSGRNCIDYLQCVEIVLNNDFEKYRPSYPPYFYGTSRVQIGGGRLWGDGSTGAWLEQAIKQYGVLSSEESGVPPYDANIAGVWGKKGPPQKFIDIAKNNLVKTTSLITNAEACADSIWKGYPVSICSNQGFNMLPSSDGFHRARGNWAHAMAAIGFEYHDEHGLYFIIINSWGDVHGKLMDFTTNEKLPIGVLRVKGEIVNSMLNNNDSYSYSLFDGYPDQSEKLNREDFKLVGR